jgi:hypothetical protein
VTTRKAAGEIERMTTLSMTLRVRRHDRLTFVQFHAEDVIDRSDRHIAEQHGKRLGTRPSVHDVCLASMSALACVCAWT